MSQASPRPNLGRRLESSTTRRRDEHAGDEYHPSFRRESSFSMSLSNASFVSDVEMARDEVFAGPISESIPTGVTGFAHRRSRANSTASFTYFQEREDNIGWPQDEAAQDVRDDDLECGKINEEDSDELESSSMRRKSSSYSARSAEDPLLFRLNSSRTDDGRTRSGSKISQTLYVMTEDLIFVVTGFRTKPWGYFFYILLCSITFGLGFIVLRWLPRWRVRLVGSPESLHDCKWVVIENQWGEFSVQDIKICTYGCSLSSVFTPTDKGGRQNVEGDDDDPVLMHLRFLNYRYVQFCFNPLMDKFVPCSSWQDPTWTHVKSLRIGLDGEEKNRRATVFGKNQIDVQQKSLVELLFDEVLHPFYIFQIASLILWSLDEYYYYAACIFIISAASITTTLLETRSTMKRLRELSHFECEVRVLHNGFWRQVISTELVPGDVYEVSDQSLTQFPCDGLLLAGDCIVNESMLTGESVPVTKIPATDESLTLLDLSAASVSSGLVKHFLFSGTKIVRARRPQDGQDDEAVALAVVIRTGFNTTKGALIRSMLFPKPSGFKFYKDAFRYISVMSGVAGVGFVASFINFVKLGLPWNVILVRALDLITIIVPPALPATLTIGTNFALSRLRSKEIFCISPQRVNVGGKLDLVCFDKTGTLTEDGLDILGLRVAQRPAIRFSDILSDVSLVMPISTYEHDPTVDYQVHMAILFTMATCHSLRKVDGKLVGDPLDVKMFEFTRWSFEEDYRLQNPVRDTENLDMPFSVVRPPKDMKGGAQSARDSTVYAPIELILLKSFEFVSLLRRASVIVQQLGKSDGDIYVKGAPECIQEICRADSLPADYEELLAFYTHRGFRVIACASRHIPALNLTQLENMKRGEVESDLEFLGFIIFENKLKPVSAAAIQELNKAGIRNIMCTGDNILTAISVARECHLIERSAHCFIPSFSDVNARGPQARLTWRSVDDPLYELDEHTLMPLVAPVEHDASSPYDISSTRNYTIAISGDVFRWIIEYSCEEVLKRVLVRGQIFARMSPDEKHELVEKLQSIDYCCGFCGDGANDCGALKAADVGISLSEAEASVAAPFTSRVFDISCVPEIIREGRAALVTSFCCFKYMSLYSAIQFTTVSILYTSASNLGDFQFLYIDLCLILPIAIFMGWSGAYPVLSRKRPTASLVSPKVLTPLLSQALICVIMQLFLLTVVRRQPWLIPPAHEADKVNIRSSENSVLFLISCFQYIYSGIILSVGPPFRQSIAQNTPLIVTTVATLLVSSYMLLDPGARLRNFMDLTMVPLGFRFFILTLAVGGFLLGWFAEKYVFLWTARLLGGIHDWILPQRRKVRKLYKTVLEDMRI